MKKSTSLFKWLALAGMALGGLGTLLSSWANDKEQDAIIEEKINERLATHENEDESKES